MGWPGEKEPRTGRILMLDLEWVGDRASITHLYNETEEASIYLQHPAYAGPWLPFQRWLKIFLGIHWFGT